MKKNIIISLAATALLSVGLGTTINQNTKAQAAVKIGRMTELQRNAYVYTRNGKKERKYLRGESVKVIAISNINGQKYAKIAPNKYIKFVNFTKKPRKATLKRNSYIYNVYGKKVAYRALKAGKQVKILGNKIINGKKYYRIGANQYIRTANVKINEAIRPNIDQNNLDNNQNTTPVQPTQAQQSTPATNPIQPTQTSQSTNQSSQPQQSTPASNPAQTSQSSNSQPTSNNQNTSPASSTPEQPTKPVQPSQSTQSTQAAKPKLPTYHAKAIKVLHVQYMYDGNGKKIIGSYVAPKQHFTWYGTTTIKGKKYYYITIDEDQKEYRYIPASAFDPKGHGLSLKDAASDKQFEEYKKQIDDITRPITNKYEPREGVEEKPIFYLSSIDKQKAYSNAKQQAYNVYRFAYSTKKDMDAAKAALQKAYNNLDGAPVHIKGTYGNPQITNAQRAQIIQLAINYFKSQYNNDIEDMHFSPDGTYLIYIENGSREESSINRFVIYPN